MLLGKPGVFLSPHLGWGEARLGRTRLHLDYVDLELTLRHASLLVHHGGVDTTARALQAGVPQIVSPLAYDQPDNADRVCALGVGRVVDRRQFTGESLAAACRELWDDASVQARLAQYAEQLRAAPALARAADLLQAHGGSPWS